MFALLGTSSLSFVSASALFGGPGLLGATAAHVVVGGWRHDLLSYLLVRTLASQPGGREEVRTHQLDPLVVDIFLGVIEERPWG